jgi:hypothetical protein
MVISWLVIKAIPVLGACPLPLSPWMASVVLRCRLRLKHAEKLLVLAAQAL